MTAPQTKTQVDRLGDRLRAGPPTASDLELLDEYRRSFRTAYDVVVGVIRDRLGLEATGRPAKSTGSIVEKLRRETIRLSQVQDIAGCRVVVGSVADQERVVTLLREAFPEVDVVDRRVNPSHGYRAVHVIVRESGKLVEVQVRTPLQHLWAELSEKASDVGHPDLKYGGGPEVALRFLMGLSREVARTEEFQVALASLEARFPRAAALDPEVQEMRRRAAQTEEGLRRDMNEFISRLGELKGKKR